MPVAQVMTHFFSVIKINNNTLRENKKTENVLSMVKRKLI